MLLPLGLKTCDDARAVCEGGHVTPLGGRVWCSHCSCRELKLEGQHLKEIPENVGNLQYLTRLGTRQILDA